LHCLSLKSKYLGFEHETQWYPSKKGLSSGQFYLPEMTEGYPQQ
jgi:hypothetical protein